MILLNLLNLVKNFIKTFTLKDWIITGLIFVSFLLLVLSCSKDAKIKKERKRAAVYKAILDFNDSKSLLTKDNKGRDITLTTVNSAPDKQSFKEMVKVVDPELVKKINKVAFVQKGNQEIVIKDVNQTTKKDIVLRDSVSKIKKNKYIADTISRYFSIKESIIIDQDSANVIIKVVINRSEVSITDTVYQFLEVGKLSNRILRIPFIKFDGIGIGGERPIISTIRHTNPFITTKENIIIINKNKLNK